MLAVNISLRMMETPEGTEATSQASNRSSMYWFPITGFKSKLLFFQRKVAGWYFRFQFFSLKIVISFCINIMEYTMPSDGGISVGGCIPSLSRLTYTAKLRTALLRSCSSDSVSVGSPSTMLLAQRSTCRFVLVFGD
jgi:hypothetical protein